MNEAETSLKMFQAVSVFCFSFISEWATVLSPVLNLVSAKAVHLTKLVEYSTNLRTSVKKIVSRSCRGVLISTDGASVLGYSGHGGGDI